MDPLDDVHHPEQQPTQGTPAGPDLSGLPPGLAQSLQAMLGGAPTGPATASGMPLGIPGGDMPGSGGQPLPSPSLPMPLAPPGPTLS